MLEFFWVKACPPKLCECKPSPPSPLPVGEGRLPAPVIPAAAKRSAGTSLDFAAQGPRSADAFGDDNVRTEVVIAQKKTAYLDRWAVLLRGNLRWPA